MPRFSKRAKRHAAESRQRTKRMLKDAPSRNGPVIVSYLPGYAPSPVRPSARYPFPATINGRRCVVHRDRIDYAD